MEKPAPVATTTTTPLLPSPTAKVQMLLNNTDYITEGRLYNSLSPEEHKEYCQLLHAKMGEVEALHNRLAHKLSTVTKTPTNELVRETNQRRIQMAIQRLLSKNHGQMPSKTQIAEVTGLSRNTIQKHMKDFMENSEVVEEYAIMVPHVMNTMLQKALKEEDVKAAKLYLDSTGKLLQQHANRPTYITIDTTTVSQADIEELCYMRKGLLLKIISEVVKLNKKSDN